MAKRLCGLVSVLLSAALVSLALWPAAAVSAGAAKEEPASLDTGPHLVGWWKFDESSGTSAADASGHGHKGALRGGLTFEAGSASGRRGKALGFDGKKGLVEILEYKGIAGARPRTVAAWVKTKKPGGEIVSWGRREPGKMWVVGFVRSRVGVMPHGGYLYMNESVADDAWHHVAVVVVPAERPNLHDHVRLYLDGKPAAIHDIGLLDLWPIDTGSDQVVQIGKGFTGLIDDLRIYDRPLSVEEIKALFAQAERQ